MTTSKIPQVPNVHELRMDGLPTDGEKGGLEPVETGSTPPDAETEPINDVTAAPPLTRKELAEAARTFRNIVDSVILVPSAVFLQEQSRAADARLLAEVDSFLRSAPADPSDRGPT